MSVCHKKAHLNALQRLDPTMGEIVLFSKVEYGQLNKYVLKDHQN